MWALIVLLVTVTGQPYEYEVKGFATPQQCDAYMQQTITDFQLNQYLIPDPSVYAPRMLSIRCVQKIINGGEGG